MEEQIQYQPSAISQTLAENPELRQEVMQGEYDNEWVKLMSKLSKNESLQDIVSYITSNHWSRRQKSTLIAYCRVLMSNRFSTTYLSGQRDYRMLYDDKELIDCTLTVGLTRFDLTPEWNILLGMINLHFGADVRMSKLGWYVQKIGTHRHEIDSEEQNREKNIGFKEKIEQKIFGD